MNLVGLLSIADDLARSLTMLKIRVQPHGPKTPLVSPEKARENAAKEVDRLLGTAVHFQRHAPAAMLGRCVLGADSKEDCSTEDDVLLMGSPSGSRLARTHRVPARRSEWSVPSNSFPTWRRLRENHGQTTFIGKILIVEREAFPERGVAVLTRDTVGFRAASRRATRPVPMEVSCRRNDPSPNRLLHMVE
ncbi:hypothetical protein [Streptomyces olivaceoviridis]|uniref:hypothetical protein n=1 Tax=Streptomyces olivaceoviridis TaxID=1921 RepID=UPI0037A61610